MPSWLQNLAAIVLLLLGILWILRRLPKVDLGHSPAFLRRRFWNWFPLGLTYAFLYMGRYNLNVAKRALGELMTKDDFGTIFFWGTLVYGCAFVVNGPLTDRIGGRKTILLAAGGSAVANFLMGLVLQSAPERATVGTFSVLYALNMYFQSFGAVSIVKVNAGWFHLRERGTFSGIFGILISLGIYFAYDWSRLILGLAQDSAGEGAGIAPIAWVFHVPAALLAVFVVIEARLVRDLPSEAGFQDFDTADAGSGDGGERLSALAVGMRMLRHPVVVVIALIEFCSGYLRQAIMQWYPIFAEETGQKASFVPANWGLLLCLAGITGGVFAGTISDRIFHSRRGPSAAILYFGMVAGGLLMAPLLETGALGGLMIFLSLCVIGVHGMLSGTASMDFAGRKNVGVAVGLIDGMVYLGTAAQALILGQTLPSGAAQKDPVSWSLWPWLVVPAAAAGFLLTLRIWNARATGKPSH